MKNLLVIVLLGMSVQAMAGQETWQVDGKTFTMKAEAINYIEASGKRLQITHTRCEIMTNKRSFKACPKNSKSWENEQFSGIKSGNAVEKALED